LVAGIGLKSRQLLPGLFQLVLIMDPHFKPALWVRLHLTFDPQPKEVIRKLPRPRFVGYGPNSSHAVSIAPAIPGPQPQATGTPAPAILPSTPAPSTQHPAPSTQNPVLRTQYSEPSTQNPVPRTQYPVPRTQYPVPKNIL